MGSLPTSVARTIWAVRALMAWGALAALLTVVLRDDLILTWARGNQAAREILEDGGLEALKDSSIRIPGFVALSVVLVVVYAVLTGVLVVFLRAGHRWAQVSLTVTAVLTAFGIAVGLGRDLPVVFAAVSVVALVLHAVLLWLLWQRDTRDYLRRA